MPSQEGFTAGNLIALQVDDRLVKELELSIDECTAEVSLQVAPSLHPPIHFGFEEAISAAAIALGTVKRQIRILQELVGVCAIVRGNANACRGCDKPPC